MTGAAGFPADAACASGTGQVTAQPYGVFRRRSREIAERHKVSLRQLLSPYRGRAVVKARQELMHTLVVEHGWSLMRAGRAIGRDHTTVLHGVRVHAARLAGEAQS